MRFCTRRKWYFLISVYVLFPFQFYAQSADTIKWTKDGTSFFTSDDNNIYEHVLPADTRKLIVSKDKLIPSGQNKPVTVEDFDFSSDNNKLLIFTNSKKVWRYNTRGDYWLLDVKSGSLKQLGKRLPVSSLMFAKFSPNGLYVAYVSNRNIYTENLKTGIIKQLTFDGNRKLINGTFDWAYEEEFFCRDGFRWSPDSKQLAYWQIDARKVKDFLMINNTDSVYPFVVPVEYPVAGQNPSPYKIGVININGSKTLWMNIPGDPNQHYLPRMEWADNPAELVIQQLNRKQNESRIMICNTMNGKVNNIYTETDEAWIDILSAWDDGYSNGGWDWLSNGKEFIWASEKDGWRHLYRISRDGTEEKLITRGNFDVIDICRIDEAGNYVYYLASPANATQKYLYRTTLDGKGDPELLSPQNQPGTHTYNISPHAVYALHSFSSHSVRPVSEWITVSDQKSLNSNDAISEAIEKSSKAASRISFFKVTTSDGVEMDGWMAKPARFDSSKKYPVVFEVYSEPAAQEVRDEFGIGRNRLYKGDMSEDGYIYMALDNRGTPAPKGRAWRKSIYRKIGLVNIRDQAQAARQILKWPFVDSSRIAVWGWSGGGSATLNLMFQYPEIYKTGIAIAAVGNQLTYDNIYQERYMGIPQENNDDFIKGSPITYVKQLRGNLLYIHGTGDDNVHFQNAEMLINELITYNKQFQLMIYPNRTHGIYEGKGTVLHLITLYTSYLRANCPPGPR